MELAQFLSIQYKKKNDFPDRYKVHTLTFLTDELASHFMLELL